MRFSNRKLLQVPVEIGDQLCWFMQRITCTRLRKSKCRPEVILNERVESGLLVTIDGFNDVRLVHQLAGATSIRLRSPSIGLGGALPPAKLGEGDHSGSL